MPSERMEAVQGGVTAPIGFAASGVSCGIKKRGKDLALIVSNRPAAVAGMLTTNRLRAPCVEWVEQVLRRGKTRGIVANSGNANCCTGRKGTQDCREMAEEAGKNLGIPAEQVLVASTGVIGQPLPMPKIRQGIRLAREKLSRTGSPAAAEAIMTTDTRPKEIAIRWKMGGCLATVGGIAKGSGMIAPNMATMLAFLTTDVDAEPETLKEALALTVPETFNSITVDGEMSTNDMVLLMANGGTSTPRIQKGTADFQHFLEAVRTVCRTLAHEIVRDGEGVTRLFTVRVTGATTTTEAMKVARQVANSILVKTMVAGRDPNWGRIAAAVGAAGVPFQPEKLVIRLGKQIVFRRGEPVRASRAALLKQVDQPEVRMEVALGRGNAEAKMLSGDLTESYIKINAKYTT